MNAKLLNDEMIPGAKTFTVEGVPKLCPFQAPFVIPNKVAGGQPSLMYANCKTSCPHCNINTTKETKYIIEITCGGHPISFEIKN
jgi:hypothetical protein